MRQRNAAHSRLRRAPTAANTSASAPRSHLPTHLGRSQASQPTRTVVQSPNPTSHPSAPELRLPCTRHSPPPRGASRFSASSSSRPRSTPRRSRYAPGRALTLLTTTPHLSARALAHSTPNAPPSHGYSRPTTRGCLSAPPSSRSSPVSVARPPPVSRALSHLALHLSFKPQPPPPDLFTSPLPSPPNPQPSASVPTMWRTPSRPA